jgi:hypothetical protein
MWFLIVDGFLLFSDVTDPQLRLFLFSTSSNLIELCTCGGGVPREDRPPGRDFVHISESAKLGTAAHGSHKTNLLGAIIRYGTFEHRLDGVTPEDLSAGRKYFDSDILETFGYRHPSVEELTSSES